MRNPAIRPFVVCNMRIKELLNEGIRRLAAAGIEETASDAWILFAWMKQVDRTWYFLHMTDEAAEDETAQYLALIDRRCGREPVQYITGEQAFMGLPFKVNPSVLIPRLDTEVLVEECLKRLKPEAKILDMCTGSGCILISLMHYGKCAHGTGADISPEALQTARGNAELNGVEADLIHTNLFEHISETYDMIVSNPPYIESEVIKTLAPEVWQHEPMLALDGTGDGLFFYRKIVDRSPEFLNRSGWLCFEIGHNQADAVSAMMAERGFEEIKVIKDLAGLDRVVVGRLQEE